MFNQDAQTTHREKEPSFQQMVLAHLDFHKRKDGLWIPSSHHSQKLTQLGHRPQYKGPNYQALRRKYKSKSLWLKELEAGRSVVTDLTTVPGHFHPCPLQLQTAVYDPNQPDRSRPPRDRRVHRDYSLTSPNSTCTRFPRPRSPSPLTSSPPPLRP